MRTSLAAMAGAAALALAGCASERASSPPPVASAPPPPVAAAPVSPVASAPLAPVGSPAPAQAGSAPPVPAPAAAALGGVLAGPIGAGLGDADRQAAWNAEVGALESGQRRSWRGANGVFGFVEPGAEAGAGCRAFSQTVYVAGRPNHGQGVGCKQPDGGWKMSS